MTTNDEQYVPSEEDVRTDYALGGARDTIGDIDHRAIPELEAEFDRFLARVRRDAEAELDSWMARAYEAEKRAWQAETRLAGWMEHWNATARTGAVDEVAAILEANARAERAEARIKAWERQYAQDIADANRETDEAEARIRAVWDVLADYAPEEDVSSPVPADPIRRALKG